jgi:outer membrane protein, multidrug efflux system
MTAAVLMGCDISEPYTAPAFPFLQGYSVGQDGPPVLLSNAAWWRGLDDPVLDHLVTLALQGNLDLDIARERVIAARALRAAAAGQGQATSSVRAEVEGTDLTDATASGSAQLGLDWVFDPYGLRREELRARNARVDIADAERDAAQLLMLFNMANAYVQLRYDQRVLALARSELRGREDTLALTRTLLAAESATRLEITRSEARVAEIRSRLPDLEAAVTTGLNQIAVLVGLAPGGLPEDLAGALAQVAAQPVPAMSPDVGIPADLLRNRPDIRIAERQYYAAVAAIGIARADLYPRLSLSGTITLNALGNGSSGAAYFFGPVMQFPSLPPDQARAVIEARHSEARQAHSAWISTVLNAILEVENALVRYDASSTSLGSARTAARLYGEALGLTRQIFEQDEATLGDLIDAEQAVATADRALADLRLQHALRFIALNVRLGAGHATDAGASDAARDGAAPPPAAQP